jgi:hypothetical protein
MGMELLEELLLELDDDDLTDDESELLCSDRLEDRPTELEFFEEETPVAINELDDEFIALVLDCPLNSGSCAPQALRKSPSRTS